MKQALTNPGRRQFLYLSSLASGASVLGAGSSLIMPSDAHAAPVDRMNDDSSMALNAWIRLDNTGVIHLAMPRSEMGQGVHTGLTTLVAEELRCAVTAIAIEDAPILAEFANTTAMTDLTPVHPEDDGLIASTLRWTMGKAARVLKLQITGGSTSTRDAWVPMRTAAATARIMIEMAAAQRFNTTADQITVRDGMVSDSKGNRLPIGQLIPHLANITPPTHVPLTPATQFTRIGQRFPRIDIPAKVNGTARFGIDVRLPGQLYAVVRMCPTLGGKVKGINNVTTLLGMPGVKGVTTVPHVSSSGGVVVVATGYWAAKQAVDKADVVWDHGPLAHLNTEQIQIDLKSALDSDRPHWTYTNRGNAQDLPADAAVQLQSSYSAPYLAHATMEPMNATVWLRENSTVEVWAPTQNQTAAREVAAKACGVPQSRCSVHTTLLGGGFGRRAESDFVMQAAWVANVFKGHPVQLIWPREEDMRHDFYRPMAVSNFKAAVDATGMLTHWSCRSASASIGHQAYQRMGLPGVGPDKATVEGAFDLPYAVDNLRVDHILKDHEVPVGFWRSVGHSYQGFFNESFMDEAAHASGQDPAAFRLKHLSHRPRHRRVLESALQRAGYGEPLPAGRAFGIALHESFHTVVAQVAEVSVTQDSIVVHRVVCSVDCGLVVNPDVVAQQIEGGIVFALSACLYGRIDITDGQVQQSNFTDYNMVSLAQAPVVVVDVIQSGEPPTGIGEPPVPPLAAAVGNAVFKLTGKRLRSLPLSIA